MKKVVTTEEANAMFESYYLHIAFCRYENLFFKYYNQLKNSATVNVKTVEFKARVIVHLNRIRAQFYNDMNIEISDINKEIGLTFEQFARIKNKCDKELKNNNSANCGDFDSAFRCIVNSVITELRSSLNTQGKNYA